MDLENISQRVKTEASENEIDSFVESKSYRLKTESDDPAENYFSFDS
jgi:hypothetical protein